MRSPSPARWRKPRTAWCGRGSSPDADAMASGGDSRGVVATAATEVAEVNAADGCGRAYRAISV